MLLALVVAALSATIAILATRDTGAGERTVVATTVQPTVTQPPATTAPPPTTAPPTTATQPPATTAPPPPPPPAVRAWPAGRSGYTIVLASVPANGGRAAPTAQAKKALGNGLANVGVLDSSQFSSLHPGYYVVFSGVYGSFGDAQTGLSRVRSAGYRSAYVRRITP